MVFGGDKQDNSGPDTEAAEINVVDKSGAWFTYGDMKLGQGRDNAKQCLIEHKELIDEIKTKVLAAKGLI